MSRLSPLQVQPILKNLQVAAEFLDGRHYVKLWAELSAWRDQAYHSHRHDLCSWLNERLAGIRYPDVEQEADVDSRMKKLQFYADILPTVPANHPILIQLVGLDAELDQQVLDKIQPESALTTAESALLFTRIASTLSPEQRTEGLLRLIADVRVEADLMPLEYESERPRDAVVSRASATLRTVFKWLMTTAREDFSDTVEIAAQLQCLYQEHLGPFFYPLGDDSFGKLYELGMGDLARMMFSSQLGHRIDVARILPLLDNPTPDELLACIVRNAGSSRRIPELFSLMFNHPDRLGVKTHLERLRLKSTGLTVNLGKDCTFETLAIQCGAWANERKLNALELEALNWWAKVMLDRLKVENIIGIERNTKTLSSLLRKGGMAVEQQLEVETIRKIVRDLIETDLGV